MISIKDFTKKYIDSIRDGNAAVFAGAGLSRPSGYVDWRGLVKPLTYMNEWSTMKRRVTIEEYAKKRSSLYEKFETPVYFMGEDTANELANNIIDFF